MASHATNKNDPLFADINTSRALQMVQSPRRLGTFVKVLAICFVVGPALLLAAPWQQNLGGSGRVVAFAPGDRLQTIEAPIDGRIVEWYVQEGTQVTAGQKLVELRDIDQDFKRRLQERVQAAEMALKNQQDQVASYETQISSLTASRDSAVLAANLYVKMTEQKIFSVQASIDAARVNKTVAEAQYNRTKTLLADGIVSQRDFELADGQFESAKQTLISLDAQLIGAKNDLAAQQANVEKTRAEAEAKIDDVRAKLEKARAEEQKARQELVKEQSPLSRQQSGTVVAPIDGTVFKISANGTGQNVKFGAPLLEIVPKTANRTVELFVSGNDAPLIREGAKVRLQFEGWPAIQFVGWPSVAVGTFGGEVALIDSTDDGVGRFRILVRPDPNDVAWPDGAFLRQGVRAKGWVLLNEVSIGYEIWRQLNGFPPVIGSKEPKADGKGKADKDGGGSSEKEEK